MACLYCRCEAVKALLELGSDPSQASENGASPSDVACPETERVLEQWQGFGQPQRRAARAYGWGYLELPRWTPSLRVHTSFPHQFKLQAAAVVLSLNVSGLMDGAGELTVLLISTMDVKHRAREALPNNQRPKGKRKGPLIPANWTAGMDDLNRRPSLPGANACLNPAPASEELSTVTNDGSGRFSITYHKLT